MKKDRYTASPLLMIISMLVLTGFVAYWLNSQFKDERQALEDELFREFMFSQNQVIDSVLLQYLHPILNDSLITEEQADYLPDSLSKEEKVATIHINTSLDNSQNMHGRFIAIEEPGGKESRFEHQLSTFVGAPDTEFFLRGVKMVMQISGDSSKIASTNGFGLAKKDTQLLQLVFADRIFGSTGREFSTRWFSDTAELNQRKSSLYLNSNHFDSAVTVEVGKIFPNVFREIIPQILFALVLLLLSGSAFFFTYRSLKRQMDLNTIRNEFISNMSHELKTPVATVKVALEALQNYDQINDPNITSEYLSMASSELDRLDQLTQKVLTHSQLEGKHLGLETEEIDLLKLSKRVIDSLSPRCLQENAKLSFLSSDSEVMVYVDPLYVEGVIINLIDNALKYAGPDAVINVEITCDEQEVRLSVSDKGPGIPKTYQKQVFDKFFRIPANNLHNVKGHGLGLSFATHVMEQHQGTIEVHNHPEGGCVFELTFPSGK